MQHTREAAFPFSFAFLIGLLVILASTPTCERFDPESKLVITTDSVQALAEESYKLTGTIVNIGGTDVKEHGFCLSESTMPTLENQVFSLGTIESKGSFTTTLTGLTCNTTYYVRAYATNSDGTSYGSERQFKTGQCILKPAVTTTSVSSIAQTSAKSGGNVISDGGGTVTARGVCWIKSPGTPTTSNDKTTDGSGSGSFTSSITGLDCNESYNVRAYATNAAGTSYGAQVQFSTSQCSGGVVVPTVTTASVSLITQTSAQGGGNVTSDGGGTIISKGVCWNTQPNPTTSDYSTNNGLGTGSFTSNLTGLECNTTYYVRAYARNSAGTSYGAQVQFTTSECSGGVVKPTVTTATVSLITETTAQSGGNVTSDGGGTVTSKGVCWNTQPYPTTSNFSTNNGLGSGSFTSNLTGLECNTTYYVRAYARNSAGVSYGTQVEFKTLLCSVTDKDGNVYETVEIGNQVWMAENLKVTHYQDGTPIPLVEDVSAWEVLGFEDKAYSWYDNSTTNRDIYGGLYTWAAAMNGVAGSDANPSGVQGVCPSGWHLPSDSEWKQLEMFLGMSQAEADATGMRGTHSEGGKLKEVGITHWLSPNTGATDEYGFTALPGGYHHITGIYDVMGVWCYFWSSSEESTGNAWRRRIRNDDPGIHRQGSYMDHGFSVRCVKDP